MFDNFLPSSSAAVSEQLLSFIDNASQSTAIGVIVFGVTAVLLLNNINGALNEIWRVQEPRPLALRFLVYWALLSLGPLLLGASLAVGGVVFAKIQVFGVDTIPFATLLLSRLVSIALSALGFTLIFYVVPGRAVLLQHAFAGGLVAAVLFELLKFGFGIYIANFGSYEAIYAGRLLGNERRPAWTDQLLGAFRLVGEARIAEAARRRHERVRLHEVDQRLALEEPAPHVVTLSLRDLERHHTTELPVAALQFGRVVGQRHDLVGVAVDVMDRHSGLRQRRQPIDRVVLGRTAGKFLRGHSEGATRLLQAGIAAQIANRIDARDRRNRLRMFDGPRIQHQTAPTARQQTGARRHAAPAHQVFVELLVVRAATGTAIGLAHIDAGDGDARGEPLLEHPTLGLRRQPAQRRRIEHPRLRRATMLFRRQDHERRATVDDERLSGQRQLLLRRRLRYE